MTLREWTDFCLSLPGTVQDFPFDNDVIAFKVGGKIFSLTSIKRWEEGDQSVNLKCDPERAIELRESYASVVPGYHMNKKHWNTVLIDDGELSEDQVQELVEHSYDLVRSSLPQKLQNSLTDPS